MMRWGLVPFFTKQLSDVKGISTSINARAGRHREESNLAHTLPETPMSGARGWLLRVEALDKRQKTICLQNAGDAPFACRGGCGMPGKYRVAIGYSLTVHYDGCERTGLPCDRSNAGHSSPESCYHRWLERESRDRHRYCLRPFESEQMVKWACNPLVGSVKNNGPEMLNKLKLLEQGPHVRDAVRVQ